MAATVPIVIEKRQKKQIKSHEKIQKPLPDDYSTKRNSPASPSLIIAPPESIFASAQKFLASPCIPPQLYIYNFQSIDRVVRGCSGNADACAFHDGGNQWTIGFWILLPGPCINVTPCNRRATQTSPQCGKRVPKRPLGGD